MKKPNERDLVILAEKKKGRTNANIGLQYNLSRERIRQICRKTAMTLMLHDFAELQRQNKTYADAIALYRSQYSLLGYKDPIILNIWHNTHRLMQN